jgi:molybdopterin-biosynthesis enzyme MoeA-like protein
LIENPVSAAPGFTIENVHVMAGVPSVFTAMVASVLPTLTGGAPLLSKTLTVHRGEGDIAGPLGVLAAAYPALSMGSYPFQRDGKYGSNLVVRGQDGALLDAAMTKLTEMFA